MLLLVAAALLGIIILAGSSQIQIDKVFEQTNYSNVNVIPSMYLLSEIQNDSYRSRIRLNRHILNTDLSRSSQLEQSMNEAIARVKAGLKKYETMLADDMDLQLLKADVEAFDAYLKHIPAIIAASNKNDNETANQLLEAGVADAMAASAAIEKHIEYNMELATNAKNVALETKSSATVFSIVTALITLITIALIGFLSPAICCVSWVASPAMQPP